MTEAPFKIGLIDSGVSVRHASAVMKGRGFTQDTHTQIIEQDACEDQLGHGSKVADIILAHAPNVRFFNAQVFDRRGVTTAQIIAAALDWLVREKVDLIHLSLGLKEDREILKKSCQNAVDHNIIIVAAAPAQGQITYPAAYSGVIKATGDARCKFDEFSALQGRQADFGACPYGLTDRVGQGGASMGAAHLTGHISLLLSSNNSPKDAIFTTLINTAKFTGSEIKSIR